MLLVRIPIGRHFGNCYYSLVNTHIHTERHFTFPSPIKINVFGLGGNQNHLQETHANTEETCKLHTKNIGAFSSELKLKQPPHSFQWDQCVDVKVS